MEYKTTVVVKLQIEGLHNWPEVETYFPKVGFLKHRHRHIFHIRVEKSVSHDDRDIEIILFKREILSYIKDRYGKLEKGNFQHDTRVEFGAMSCEMIAKELVKRFGLDFCEVLEDGENGAKVYCEEVDFAPIVFVSGKSASGKQTFVENRLSNFKHYIVSDYVKELLGTHNQPRETTSDLNDTKDLAEDLAKRIISHIQSDIRDYSQRLKKKTPIVIDGCRQLSIIQEIGSFLNQSEIEWQVLWLDVSQEERTRRFLKRNRQADSNITLKELDEKNEALGILEIKEFAETMNRGIIIEN